MPDAEPGVFDVLRLIAACIFVSICWHAIKYSDESDPDLGVFAMLRNSTKQITQGVIKQLQWHILHISNLHFHTSQISFWESNVVRFIPVLIQAILLVSKVDERIQMVFFVSHMSGTLFEVGSQVLIVVRTLRPPRIQLRQQCLSSLDKGSPLSCYPPYRHRPLSPASSGRVLLLYPSWSGNDVLSGQLIEVAISSKIYYDALSYVWGSGEPEDYIVIQDHVLPISLNCADALRSLRQRTMGRIVWIDSICINQQDLAEKIEQIKRMEDIYVGASRTVFWLGKGGQSARRAIGLFKICYCLSWLPERLQIVLINILDRMRSAPGNVHACTKFFDSSWFTRVWTFQECLLTQRTHDELRYGCHTLSMQTLKDAIMPFSTLVDAQNVYNDDLKNCIARFLVRHFFQSQMSKNCGKLRVQKIHPMLLWTQDLDSTDPRDKIYGFLSIFRRAGCYLPEPSYDKSISHVFWEAMITVTKHDASLGLLQLCFFPRSCDMQDVPTWVPDLRKQHVQHHTKFETRNDTKIQSEFRFSADFRRLYITGCLMDKIQAVSQQTLRGTAELDQDSRYQNSYVRELRPGTDRMILALVDWFLLCDVHTCSSRYSDLISTFGDIVHRPRPPISAELPEQSSLAIAIIVDVLYALDLLPIPAEGFTPKEKYKIRNMIDTHLTTIANDTPELFEQFFNVNAPLNYLTSDPKWRALCFLITEPTLRKAVTLIRSKMQNSTVFMTKSGYLGTAALPSATQDNVVVALIPGVVTPIILKKAAEGQYKVLGPAYVAGIMEGKQRNVQELPEWCDTGEICLV